MKGTTHSKQVLTAQRQHPGGGEMKIRPSFVFVCLSAAFAIACDPEIRISGVV
jgi:hypothetical protein